MPMFNYQCTECGQYVEDKMVSRHDTIVICNICGNTMEKCPSACNFSIEPAVKK